MGTRVKLSDLIEGMEFQSDEISIYLNRKTGAVISITDDEFSAAENETPMEEVPEWQRPKIKAAQEFLLAEDDYLALPSKYDINEYQLMEQFSTSRENGQHSDALLDALNGRGAFRRFKDTVHRLGIDTDWYEYRDGALEDIARFWCKENEVELI